MGEFVFDPRVFILPPFKQCPRCGCEECFGVLMIGGTQYTRRCRECWYDEPFALPEISKTVIYLDQMAISNMTKILHPQVGQGRQLDPFWRDLFERIDVLCKLQVLICPDSQTHREESALAPYAAALRRMYELFSHGATFDFSHQIRDGQLLEYLSNWLAGEPERRMTLDVTRVTHGQIHGWQERFTITVGGLDAEDWPERLRESRERIAEGMARFHEGWRQEQNFDFERAYRRELTTFGDMVIRLHLQSVERQARILTGEEPYDFDALMPTNATSLVLDIHHRLREAGVAEEELWQQTVEFFRSDSLDAVPYMRGRALHDSRPPLRSACRSSPLDDLAVGGHAVLLVREHCVPTRPAADDVDEPVACLQAVVAVGGDYLARVQEQQREQGSLASGLQAEAAARRRRPRAVRGSGTRPRPGF